MARRPSKHLRPPRPLSDAFATSDTKADGRWVVQGMTASRAVKSYLCPGCNRAIAPGEPHVVTWPAVPVIGSSSGVEDRRHWHRACWNRRP